MVVAHPTIGPSGKTLAVLFKDGLDAPTILRTLTGAPSVSVNGGSPTALNPAYALWGPDANHAAFGRPVAVPYLPWVLYPLGLALADTDSAVITWPDGWATTAAGAVAGATTAVANLTGGSFLTPFDPAAKRMRIGSNMPPLADYQPIPLYANLAKQATSIGPASNLGYPTTGFPITALIVPESTADPTDPRGYPGPPAGTWTLIWDGDHAANLVLAGGNATTSSLIQDITGMAGVDHTRTYNITVNTAVKHTPRVLLTLNAAGATNIRVYSPGEPTEGAGRFSTELLRMVGGNQVLRFMNSTKTNRSSVVDPSDLPNPDQFSYFDSWATVGGAVVSLSPYTAPDNAYPFNPDWCSFVVTFAAPHRARTGQILVFAGNVTTPSGDGKLQTTGGGTSQTLWGGAAAVRVLSETQLATYHFVPGSGQGGTILGTYAQPAGVSLSTKIQVGMPFGDCAGFATAAGSDCWLNIPHASTDATVALLALQVLAQLGPGKKWYCELGNEHWNVEQVFEATEHFNCLGRGMPGAGAAATATVAGGVVTGLRLTSAGSGYRIAPNVNIAKGAATVQAKAHATLINGVMTLIVDNPGVGYSAASPPAVTFGTFATGTAAYTWRSGQVHALVLAAFTAAGRAADLVRVMGCQGAVPGASGQGIITTAVRNGISFDSLAIAPYWDNETRLQAEPVITPGLDRLDVDGLLDLTEIVLRYSAFFPPLLADFRARLDAAGFTAVKIVCYEGGMQNGAPVGVNSVHARSLSWARHPRMRGIFLDYLQKLEDGGVDLYTDFLLASTIKDDNNWARHFAYGQLDGLGDGSDALHDNRLDYFNMTTAVSVIGGATQTWAELAHPDGPPVDRPPVGARPRGLPRRLGPPRGIRSML